MTEAELVARLARELGPLAVDAGWSSTATTGQPYGAYSDAVMDALSESGIVDPLETVADWLTLRDVQESALLHCLRRLELHYSTLTDTSTGQGAGGVTQKLSQVRAALATVAGRLDATRAARAVVAHDMALAAALAAVPSAVGVTIRGRPRPDYTLAEGDAVEPEPEPEPEPPEMAP